MCFIKNITKKVIKLLKKLQIINKWLCIERKARHGQNSCLIKTLKKNNQFSKLREKVKILEKLEIEREHEPQSTKKSSVLERAKIFTTISRWVNYHTDLESNNIQKTSSEFEKEKEKLDGDHDWHSKFQLWWHC